MANPRAVVSHDENNVKRDTFIIDDSTITYDATEEYGSAQAGQKLAVTLSASDTVALAADGDAILGILDKVEADGFCVVSLLAGGGFLGFQKGNGATVTRGKSIVGALGASSAKGYIREAASGTAAELVKCRGMIINNADDANVIVMG